MILKAPTQAMKYFLAILAAAAMFAQTPAPLKNIVGPVAAIDAANGQFTVQADSGVYTVKIAENTKFLRIEPGETDMKKATPSAFTDLGVGDRVIARGAVSDESKTVAARTVVLASKTDIAKRQDDERQAWQKGVTGTVKSI